MKSCNHSTWQSFYISSYFPFSFKENPRVREGLSSFHLAIFLSFLCISLFLPLSFFHSAGIKENPRVRAGLWSFHLTICLIIFLFFPSFFLFVLASNPRVREGLSSFHLTISLFPFFLFLIQLLSKRIQGLGKSCHRPIWQSLSLLLIPLFLPLSYFYSAGIKIHLYWNCSEKYIFF